ncbi:MAG: InlB B-repeat-containing protein [Lachnospiraceae bacterium]|nr:InlB B-repeat-containing protein [Lachnospiraceae bacterium]
MKGHGSAIASQSVKDGETASDPGAPTAEGFTFGGWYADAACTTAYDFAAPIKGDVTIYAKWTKNSGGDKADSFTVEFASLSDDPYEGLTYNDNRYEIAYTGDAIKPDVSVKGPEGLLAEGVDYTVKYANNKGYSKNGKPATVTITGKGNLAGKATLQFYILQADLAAAQEKGLLIMRDEISVQSGKKPAPAIVYRGSALKASDRTLSITAAVKEDTALTITGKGNFTGELADIPVKVLSAAELKAQSIKVTLKAGSHVYDGTPQWLACAGPDSIVTDGEGALLDTGKAELTVTAGAGKDQKVLTAGTDYILTYAANTDAGTAKVAVTAMGAYVGAATKTFKILPDKAADITASLSDPDAPVYYAAKGAAPDVTVTLSRNVNGTNISEELTPGIDYKVSYSGNKKVSYSRGQVAENKAKYTVSFIGNYKGHKPIKGAFTVAPASLAGAEAVCADQLYTGKPGKYRSAPYVTVDGALLTSKDYTVEYALGESFSEEAKLAAKESISLGGDEASATITVRVTGKGNYRSEPVTASYRVLRAADAVNLSKAKIVAKEKNAKGKDVAVGKQPYTGREIEPEIRVLAPAKDGKKTVWKEVSADLYNVTYINNVNKGTATILITGNGTDAAGSKTAKFTISAASLKK